MSVRASPSCRCYKCGSEAHGVFQCPGVSEQEAVELYRKYRPPRTQATVAALVDTRAGASDAEAAVAASESRMPASVDG